jgi:hypothetical protein
VGRGGVAGVAVGGGGGVGGGVVVVVVEVEELGWAVAI